MANAQFCPQCGTIVSDGCPVLDDQGNETDEMNFTPCDCVMADFNGVLDTKEDAALWHSISGLQDIGDVALFEETYYISIYNLRFEVDAYPNAVSTTCRISWGKEDNDHRKVYYITPSEIYLYIIGIVHLEQMYMREDSTEEPEMLGSLFLSSNQIDSIHTEIEKLSVHYSIAAATQKDEPNSWILLNENLIIRIIENTSDRHSTKHKVYVTNKLRGPERFYYVDLSSLYIFIEGVIIGARVESR